MYSILFHVGWLMLIEIVFYFEYIGPLETTVYKNSLKNVIRDFNTNNNITSYPSLILVDPYNKSHMLYINQTDPISDGYKNSVKNAENDRLHHNKLLYNKAIMYWGFFGVISIVVSGGYLCAKYYIFYREKQHKLNSITSVSVLSIEMTEQRDLNYYFEEIPEIQPPIFDSSHQRIKDIEATAFFNLEEIPTKTVRKFIHYLVLGGCIIVFEYLFFTHIILNYDIISEEELIYLMSKIATTLLHNDVLKLTGEKID